MATARSNWALIASLVLNVFLLAALVGGVMVVRQHARAFRHDMPGLAAWQEANRPLTPDQRMRVIALIKSAALAGEDDMAKARATRKQAADVAAQQPYNAVQVAMLSEQARNYENDARSHVENALIAGMANLTPQERTVIAGQLLRPSARFSRFATHDHDGPPAMAASASPASQ